MWWLAVLCLFRVVQSQDISISGGKCVTGLEFNGAWTIEGETAEKKPW